MKRSAVALASIVLNHRQRAGVLQLTLGISIVISILCASMIMLGYFGKIVFLSQSLEDNLRDNATSGIQYGMAVREDLNFHEVVFVDLFGDEIDSVEIIRKPWGVFEILVSNAYRGTHRVHKSALITALPNEIGKSIIYEPENNTPIYLVGNTSLEGKAYISERKFSTGFINGQGYEAEKFLTGETEKSTHDIPVVDTVLLYAAKSLMQDVPDIYKINHLDKFPVGEQLSFLTLQANRYYSEQSIDISAPMGGNIIIQSGMKLRVTSEARLNDVILIAPDIDIDKGFEGSIQCFATRSIIVGKDSKLKYPSALVLLNNENDSLIVIRENAQVEGIVVMPGFDQSILSKGIFKIEKNGILHGMAYINGKTDVQGSIWGHITTRSFTVTSGSGEYFNHILNGEITDKKHSDAMPGSLLWANTKDLVVSKWLE